MIPIFPQIISRKGLQIYLLSLALISILFLNHTMGIEYIIIGIVSVAGFFVCSATYTKRLAKLSPSSFCKSIFSIALLIRLIWVVVSYFFFQVKYGQPFEFEAADSLAYHLDAEWLSNVGWGTAFNYWSHFGGISDTGYSFWLTCIYRIFGPSIIIARICKAVISSFSCVLIYRLASRNIGELPGRMAAIFSVFMPNLIIYCGLHLKETEMIFCILMFLERADYLIRTRKYNFVNIFVPAIFAFSLFFFRTVLGVVALMAFFAGLLFTSARIVGTAKRILLIVFWTFVVTTFVGGTISMEINKYWNLRNSNEAAKRSYQVAGGARLAQYATGAVLAPAIIILPLSTMVDTNQDTQMILHGGNFVRNFMGIFVLIALFHAIFKGKNWRDFSLIGSFVIGYLGIISVSGYGNAERFLLPALPCLLIMAAYGVSLLNGKYYKWVKYWYVIVIFLEISWATAKMINHGGF